ncbi:MAG: PIN domain-containing protein [Acidobacteria bacterium]|nr:PIN domain-containing protein [Acidobacteriota bacterium]
MSALLDVNVLVALFHARHVHHDAAHRWFRANAWSGWATCPTTINGAVRILSNAAAGLVDARPNEVARRLELFCRHQSHEFWPEGLCLLDSNLFRLEFLQGRRQITDAYLLALAVKQKGQIVTFDAAVPWRAVRNASEGHILLL